MENTEDIARHIRQQREQLGLSQADLAKRTGTTQQTIDRIERRQVLYSRVIPRLRQALASPAESAPTPGARLRQARKAASMSAKDLGDRVGLVESAVRNQENGTNGIKLETADLYAKALGVTAEWLMFGAGEQPTATASPQLQMTALANGKARLEMNMVVPMAVALKVLELVHADPTSSRASLSQPQPIA